MRPRSITVIGILSLVLGAIQILGIPLAIFISNVLMPYLRSVSPAAPTGSSSAETLLSFLVANIHWVDPNIAVAVAIFIDIPLAIVLIRSGRRTLRVQPAGRRLAILYAAIVLALEGFNVIFVALNWEQWTRSFERPYIPADPMDFVWAGLSFARKISYPIVLLIFFTRPRIRAYFLPEVTP